MTTLEINTLMAHMVGIGSPAVQAQIRESLVAALYAIEAAPAQAAAVPTYSSTQATECAGCGKRKHTPLRIDAMGGYVCLTCIDQKLGSLLGEFGYPDAAQAAERDAARYRHLVETCNVDFDPSEPWQLVIWEPSTGKDWKEELDADIDAAIDRLAAPAGGLGDVSGEGEGS
jgi:hypothetical protein